MKITGVRTTLILVLAVILAGRAAANVVNNGSFELNSAGMTRYNLANTDFTGFMQSAGAFGTSDELEIVTAADFGIPPQSGSWKVGMHEKPDLHADAFSLSLSSSIPAGTTCTLSFYTVGIFLNGAAQPLGPVEFGLSSNPFSFGTLIGSGAATSTDQWTPVAFEFVAPTNSFFLPLRTSSTVPNMYAFVDSVSIEVPEPWTLLLMWPLFAGRRCRSQSTRPSLRRDRQVAPTMSERATDHCS